MRLQLSLVIKKIILDDAENVVALGGDVSVSEARDIQETVNYDASGSAYTITDSASAILGDTGSVIHEGVTEINVDGPVGAGVGVQLGSLEDASFETGYSADLNYNVMDDAGAIATELAGDAGALDNAEHVVVDGGDTTVAGASDIQGVAAYDASGSAYTITDSASAILGDTGSVIHEGVSGVIVADATGASSVDAVDGAALSELESQLGENVEFRIEDSAGAIAAELSSDNTLLDGADDLVVDGGDTTVAGASDIQGVAEYDASGSAYTITDSASAILGDTGSVIDEGVSGVNVVDVVNASNGMKLSSMEMQLAHETGFSADINFNVVDGFDAFFGEDNNLDTAVDVSGANSVVINSSDVALGADEYSSLSEQVEGGDVSGWIDFSAVKPEIVDFQVDTGIYDTDNETADSNIILEVKAERGSTFEIANNKGVVSVENVSIKAEASSENGLSEGDKSELTAEQRAVTNFEYDIVTYEISLATPLIEGENGIIVTATDAAGNSASSNTLSITYDQTNPVSTAVLSPAGGSTILDDNATIMGTVNEIAIPDYNGTGKTALELFVKEGDFLTELPSSTAGIHVDTTTGTWSVALSGDDIRVIGQGDDRTIVIRSHDIAGNQSDNEVSYNVYATSNLDTDGVVEIGQLGNPQNGTSISGGDNF